jgi:hypothetical protein
MIESYWVQGWFLELLLNSKWGDWRLKIFGPTVLVMYYEPVMVAEWYKAWTVLVRLDAGIVGLNPIRGMDVYVYVYVYSMFVLSYVDRGLAMSWSLIQGVLPTGLD